MTKELNTKIENVVSILKAASEEVQAELNGTPYTNLAIRSKNAIDQLINTAKHTAGLSTDKTESKETLFEPITSFMGEKVVAVKEISQDDVKVDKKDVTNYIEKVNKLYDTIEEQSNDEVLKNYINDTNVIRGVAKKAGVKDFKNAELNVEFLEVLRKSVTVKKELDAKTKAIADAAIK